MIRININKYLWPFVVLEKLVFRRKSYLRSSGWIESVKMGYPCRNDGRIIPWMNYAAVRFLEGRLNEDLNLFEFGSGYSTVFYSSRVACVVAVEHDQLWFDKVKQNISENVEIIHKKNDCDGDYCRAVHLKKQRYDVVIVDGVDRVNCIKQSIEALSNRGVIVLDDSQRKAYMEGVDHIKEKGFKSLEFEGLKPNGGGMYLTTLFYRTENCLGI
jgi:hypothetical protein